MNSERAQGPKCRDPENQSPVCSLILANLEILNWVIYNN